MTSRNILFRLFRYTINAAAIRASVVMDVTCPLWELEKVEGRLLEGENQEEELWWAILWGGTRWKKQAYSKQPVFTKKQNIIIGETELTGRRYERRCSADVWWRREKRRRGYVRRKRSRGEEGRNLSCGWFSFWCWMFRYHLCNNRQQRALLACCSGL